MSLEQWAKNGWLRPHKASAREIADLLAIVDRDLKDAGAGDISTDWKFGIAYNAALKLCTILLHASGYRPEKSAAPAFLPRVSAASPEEIEISAQEKARGLCPTLICRQVASRLFRGQFLPVTLECSFVNLRHYFFPMSLKRSCQSRST